MMHGPEKSDSPIVATKQTNKAARAAAEPVERRGEAKGNAQRLRTRRTQCRISVSQQLDRVRQAARTKKKERFRHIEWPEPLRQGLHPTGAETEIFCGRAEGCGTLVVSFLGRKVKFPQQARLFKFLEGVYSLPIKLRDHQGIQNHQFD